MKHQLKLRGNLEMGNTLFSSLGTHEVLTSVVMFTKIMNEFEMSMMVEIFD